MWKSRMPLPLSLPAPAAGGASAAGSDRAEQAVLVAYRVPRGADPADLPGLPDLEDAVEAALRDTGAGELEGVQPGPGTLTLLTYGADAEKLWSSIEAVARTFPCRPARATLRYGLVGAPDRSLPL